MENKFSDIESNPAVRAAMDVDVKKLDLSGLTSFPITQEACDAAHEKVEAEIASFKAKYGDGWYKAWFEHCCGLDLGYDRAMKLMNEAAYYSGYISISGDCSVIRRETEKFDKRLHDLYGDRYDELIRTHEHCDPRVGELLITEALHTGRWKELPDELQGEYKRRVKGIANKGGSL